METNEIKQKISRFRAYIKTLLGLFYGLAIGHGIYHVSKMLLCHEKNNWLTILLLSITSFVIAISDWFYLHLTIDKNPYKNIWRLILDILFPTLIFFLFLSTCDIITYLIFYSIYFLLTFIYSWRIIIEKGKPPSMLFPFLYDALILIGVFIIQSYWYAIVIYSEILTYTILITYLGLLYGVIVFYNVSQELILINKLDKS